jgi:hypothetical protein
MTDWHRVHSDAKHRERWTASTAQRGQWVATAHLADDRRPGDPVWILQEFAADGRPVGDGQWFHSLNDVKAHVDKLETQ